MLQRLLKLIRFRRKLSFVIAQGNFSIGNKIFLEKAVYFLEKQVETSSQYEKQLLQTWTSIGSTVANLDFNWRKMIIFVTDVAKTLSKPK